MIGYTYNLTATVATAAIPPSLLVEPTHAWALLGFVLVLSCSVLWYLTKPRANQQQAPEIPPTPVRHARPLQAGSSIAARSLEPQRLHA